jgi:hypothetical protein
VDVPSFAGTDLAPGPPLTLAQPGVPENREYQNVRPDADFATWQAAIESAKIPTAEAEAKAIKSGTSNELDQLAVRLTAASDAIHAAPDPTGERPLSTRIQLGLLVQAESMRGAQISKLVSNQLRPEAVEITEVLALLGNGMWDDTRLGPRTTGFPATLLTVRPKVAPPPVAYDVCPTPSAGTTATDGPAATPATPAATPAAAPACAPPPNPTGAPTALPTP